MIKYINNENNTLKLVVIKTIILKEATIWESSVKSKDIFQVK